MLVTELYNLSHKLYPQTQKVVRAAYNRTLFDELKKVIDLKQLLCEMGISKNYYINYLNGYSVLSMLQITKIIDFLTEHYKLSDNDSTYALLVEKIVFSWVITKIYEN